MPRERWTDERLDEAFDRLDSDIRELRVEMRQGFERIDKRFDQIDKRFERIDKRFERVDDKFDAMQSEMNLRFESVQRTMMMGFVTLFASIVASPLVIALATSLA